MKRTTVYLEESADLALSQIAKQRGRSKADLIREALATLIEREGRTVADEVPSWVGAGDSGGYVYTGQDDGRLAELLEADHEAALVSYDVERKRRAKR